MPPPAPTLRTILIFTRDRGGRPLPGTTIAFAVGGVPVGTVPDSEGRASIQLDAGDGVVTVSAAYGDETQRCTLAANQDDWTFTFDVDTGPGFMEKRVPLLVGLGMIAVAVALAFVFGTPTVLQTRLILAVASLGGGLIATEIPGMMKIDLKFGQKVAIGATGALGVFVLLYLVLPAM